ncbi:hypothetical protein MMA231_04059 (plasmid) [Asticcacaulis sp. MM231]|uniref:methyl-accepting chemotaxis protein n=1 Tax=Asticcacaulis sp. MM231 TaxID=3157666 RepID=UPI0032D56C76
MNIHSVKTKIVALSALCLLAATGALVGYGIFSSGKTTHFVNENVQGLLDKSSSESLTRLASAQAGTVRAEVDTAFSSARNMARSLEVVAGPDGAPKASRRRQLNDILVGVLKDNPRFNGTYSAWMPNALDGADGAYVNRKEMGADTTGRALPYWTRNAQGQIALQPLVEYDSRELHTNGLMKGGWFIGPETNGRESILAPLPYIVQGKNVFLATMSVPIIVEGQFKGVAGADFDLTFVQTLALDVKKSIYDGKGNVTIVTSDGLVVASSAHPDAIGSTVESLDPLAWNALADIKAGKSFVNLDKKHDDMRVYAPIELGRSGQYWSVIISVPRTVVMADADRLSNALKKRGGSDVMWEMVCAGIVAVLGIGVIAVMANNVANPIARLTEALGRLAKGEKLLEIAGAERRDEIGDISRAVDRIREVTEEEALQKAAGAEAERIKQDQDRRDIMLKLANEFEKSVGGIVTLVSSAATEMQASAQQLSTTAQRATSQSIAVSAAAEEAGANVTSVASSAEELGASVNEIGRQVETSATISAEAVREASGAVQIVDELNEVTASIGGVVDLIAGLASQTNLLALNATIELARAGEAGKGFAVVASEVKALAGQTARATTEISAKIAHIQEATAKAASAIANISGTIQNINQTNTIIASAVEQQTAATQEIVQAVNQASIGTQEVTSNITGVASAAEQTGTSAVEVLNASAELAQQAERLHHEMDKFLATVRAA